MPRIVVEDVRAWVENSKLNPQALDLEHLDQIETEILATIGNIYDTSTWLDNVTTPRLVQVIIAKMYTSWLYAKFYSENQSESNEYANNVRDNAEMLMAGILDGTIEIPGIEPINPQVASFYPNDLSSSQLPSADDYSLGPAKFSIGKVF